MQIDKQTDRSSSRLILFFNGWSASPALFRRFADKAEADVWVCYDYCDLTFDDAIRTYTDIHLIAWSLGVWVAEQIAGRYPRLPIRTATAVNGTPYPIDERYGIPPTLFRATLDNLSPEGIARFTRRMCGSRKILDEYARTPARPAEAVEAELHALYRLIRTDNRLNRAGLPSDLSGDAVNGELSSAHSTVAAVETGHPRLPWSHAVLSQHDRIFPPENLRRYWAGRCPVSEPEAPHYPFYLWNEWKELCQ